MKTSAIAAVILTLLSISVSGCASQADSHEPSPEPSHAESHAESHAAPPSEAHAGAHEGAGHHDHKIVVTSPVKQDVISTQPYVCQIHSCKHI